MVLSGSRNEKAHRVSTFKHLPRATVLHDSRGMPVTKISA